MLDSAHELYLGALRSVFMTTVRRALAVALVTVGALAWPAASAQATTGDVYWSASVKTSSTTSALSAVRWNILPHTVTMSVVTGPLAAGTCVTAYFDWSSTGHHDARALRSCVSSGKISYVFKDATPQNIINRPTKLGVCYGPLDKRGI